MIAAIVAYDINKAIGVENKLLWHLPEDLKNFKALTSGKSILLGRKTLESIGRLLPNRTHYLVSRSKPTNPDVNWVSDPIAFVKTWPKDEELWIIGGGEIYNQLLPLCDRLVITEVEVESAHADTWFPSELPGKWEEVSRVEYAQDDKHALAFRILDFRKSSD